MHLLLKHMSIGLHDCKSSFEQSSDYLICNWSYQKEDMLVEKYIVVPISVKMLHS